MLRVLREPVEILVWSEFPARIIHVRVCRGCSRWTHSDDQVSKQEEDDKFKCVSVYSIWKRSRSPTREESWGIYRLSNSVEKAFIMVLEAHRASGFIWRSVQEKIGFRIWLSIISYYSLWGRSYLVNFDLRCIQESGPGWNITVVNVPGLIDERAYWFELSMSTE